MRGTFERRRRQEEALGLIPAGAGNIAAACFTAAFLGAHPRGCGEHVVSGWQVCRSLGSSPRVRGTCTFTAHYDSVGGLIPAGAGNILSVSSSKRAGGAHPRGCGEHRTTVTTGLRRMGSSPRVRGTSPTITPISGKVGLIPAGAGNIVLRVFTIDLHRAHPRGCGEHSLCYGLIAGGRGSSPRVRGTLIGFKRSRLISGLIPAGAGNIFRRKWVV